METGESESQEEAEAKWILVQSKYVAADNGEGEKIPEREKTSNESNSKGGRRDWTLERRRQSGDDEEQWI